jgi:uncharacterized membrane protein
MSRLSKASPYLLVGVLAGAGVTHLIKPGFYDPIVPHALPGPPRAWTYLSGVAELGVAVAVAHPETRKHGALAAALLFIAVYPANIQMAADARSVQDRVISYVRLPLQFPLIWWAFKVSRASDRRGWLGRAR